MSRHPNAAYVGGLVLLALGGVATTTPPSLGQDIDRAPIHYSTAPTQNVVSRLQDELQAGKRALQADDNQGYLKALLEALDVPVSSQVLVFSKTSLQRARISARTPRALYFNDDVTVGYCRKGEVLEIAANDPNLGTVFYTLDQTWQPGQPSQELIARQTDQCLICHGSSRNQGVPGHLVRSVAVKSSGELVLTRGTVNVDHATPLDERWGGWFVTGTSGKQTHQGNQVVGGWPRLGENAGGANITDLRPFFSVGNYLSPHSDLVALMVLEHQTEVQNRISQANFRVRSALYEQIELNKAFGKPADAPNESITKRIHWACEPLVEYLLFAEEAPLREPIAGTSAFAAEFTARGPRDAQQRTLREFDLKTRMFRYPLSYVIYSQQFDGLPPEAKARIYQRLWEVLSGKDTSKPFAHLTEEGRRAAREILKATKPGLPDYWH